MVAARDTLGASRQFWSMNTSSTNISAKMFYERHSREYRRNILGGDSFRALLRISCRDNALCAAAENRVALATKSAI
jgi:hypothetical protein